MAKGWPVHAIDTGLTAKGKDERAISVSSYVYQGQVKISHHAHDKRKLHKNQDMNHFESQVCGFRIGMADGKQADDLADTFMYGISIGLGNADGY
jgi:hypothetical protein